MQDFLETGFGSGATKNDDRLEDEIKQVLTDVKSRIAVGWCSSLDTTQLFIIPCRMLYTITTAYSMSSKLRKIRHSPVVSQHTPSNT